MTYVLLALILIGGLVLARMLYASPFYSFDDANYLNFAHQILSGGFNPAESTYAYGFLLPISLAISFLIFGTGVFAAILPSIAEYIILIVLSFAIARKLYGNNVGIISAFLIAAAPFVVGYSTRVLPDMGVGVFAGFSLLFLVYAQESGRSNLLYLLSGASAALTIYVKMIGLAYILFFMIILLFYRPKRAASTSKRYVHTLIYPFAGIFLVLIAYVCIMFLYSGSLLGPFIAYGQNQSAISLSSIGNNINTMLVLLFGYSSPYKTFLGPVSDPQVFTLGLIIFWALVGTAIGIYQRRKETVCMSVLLWGVFFYLLFGTVTLTKYSLIFVVTRYFIMISVPMAVLGGYVIYAVYNASRPLLRAYNTSLLVLILVVVIISNIPVYMMLYNYNLTISGNTRTLSSVLKYAIDSSPGSNGIYLFTNENSTASFIEFLSSYNSTIHTSALNLSNRNAMTRQLSRICVPYAGNIYLALSYDNYSALQYNTILNDWIIPNCNLTRLRNFSDNLSSGSIYNQMNIHVELYKVN